MKLAFRAEGRRLTLNYSKADYALNREMLRAVLNGYGIDTTQQCLLYRAKMDDGWLKNRTYDLTGISTPLIQTDEESQHEYAVTSELDDGLDPADFGQRVSFRQ